MSKELEKLDEIKHRVLYHADGHAVLGNEEVNFLIAVAKSSLQRLEVIENVSTSTALENLKKFIDNCIFAKDLKEQKDTLLKNIDVIKRALLKTQESKHYLKWEDLEFDREEQTMKVSLNESIHRLCYYRNMFGSLCMIDNTGITIWEDNKNFFNDLHLERIE